TRTKSCANIGLIRPDESSPKSEVPQDPKVVVVNPAYNEERLIGSVVIKARYLAKTMILADDGSGDATGQIAQEAGAIVISHQKLIKEELHLVFRSLGCELARFNNMFLIDYSQFLSIGSV
ncbi:MAG: glycosyltransferase, partial [Anaerolineales bacterium]|nr:glycosyltransferase [Anaerolineales bacterium]